MAIVLFEDQRVAQLDPMAVGKPAFAISCGGYRLIDIAAELNQPVRAIVRPHLRVILAEDFPELLEGRDEPDQPTLWINARLVPSAEVLERLRLLLTEGRAGVVLA